MDRAFGFLNHPIQQKRYDFYSIVYGIKSKPLILNHFFFQVSQPKLFHEIFWLKNYYPWNTQ
jgi:hypothetical protein